MYLAALLLVSVPFLGIQTAIDPSGHWEGKIHMPDHELGISVDLEKGANGAWIGSMSVTLSTATDVPLEDIALDNTSLRFSAGLPGRASFEGRMSADVRALSGTASNLDGSAPFDLTRTGEPHVKVPPPSSTLPKDLEGQWDASVDAHGKPVRLTLKLWRGPDGTAHGTLLAARPGSEEVALTTITATATSLQFESRAVSGSYHGTLGAGGEIAGEWAQGSVLLPLTFRRGPAPAVVK